MQVIDDKGMGVVNPRAAMLAQVRVIWIELGVGMLDDLGIVGRPDRSGDRRA
jgi:hypothetical protein